MKLEVGQFARLKTGYIVKILNVKDDWIETDTRFIMRTFPQDFAKASYNIIDLIKSKDIILGKDGKIYQCWKIYKEYVFTYSKNKQGQTITLVDYQIDKVLTKEQFEQMAYKVGE